MEQVRSLIQYRRRGLDRRGALAVYKRVFLQMYVLHCPVRRYTVVDGNSTEETEGWVIVHVLCYSVSFQIEGEAKIPHPKPQKDEEHEKKQYPGESLQATRDNENAVTALTGRDKFPLQKEKDVTNRHLSLCLELSDDSGEEEDDAKEIETSCFPESLRVVWGWIVMPIQMTRKSIAIEQRKKQDLLHSEFCGWRKYQSWFNTVPFYISWFSPK